MRITLFQLLLLTGTVSTVLSLSSNYYLIQSMKTWSEAQSYCQFVYTDLAVLNSITDVARLIYEAQKQRFFSGAWIGLSNDIGSWHWAYDSELLGISHWKIGQPNNQGGNEECAVADYLGWADSVCTSLAYLLCFDSTNGSYILISAQMTWYDARAYCIQHYTDLAKIIGPAEYALSQKALYTSANVAWIGLIRDSWKWTNGRKMSTIGWVTGQPDNLNLKDNCGFIINGQASDALCSETMPFFCYSYQESSGSKQILRVKIKSKQDVNDPAVKAAILEKIREKLMEHGVAQNATVKWVKQPGGVVFGRK